MNTPRALCGVLTAGIVAAVAGCGGAAERAAERTPAPPAAQQPPRETLKPLLQAPLPNVPGKTFTSAIVAFPPGARAVPHRHGGAFVYAYVLEGTVASRLAGQRRHTYRAGDDWVEKPGADHVLTQNLSSTKPAKLLVVFVAKTGAKLKVDDHRH